MIPPGSKSPEPLACILGLLPDDTSQESTTAPAAYPQPTQHMRAAVPTEHQPDCEEKRDPDEGQGS